MTKRLRIKVGGAGGELSRTRDKEAPGGFSHPGSAVGDLFLLRHIGGERREALHQPVMRVERARRAEMRLDPGKRVVAHPQSLSHHQTDESAQRTNDQDKKDQKGEPSRERSPAAEHPRHPAIERPAQPGEQCSENERHQERPGDGEECGRHRQHQDQDESRSERGAADIGAFHGEAVSPGMARGINRLSTALRNACLQHRACP